MKNRLCKIFCLALFMAGVSTLMPVAMAAEDGVATPQLRLAPATQSAGPRTFMVFFDYDSVTISSPARDLLTRISSMVKEEGVTLLTLTGHTDTAGSRFYNLGLSQRRALAVNEILRQSGVPESATQVY